MVNVKEVINHWVDYYKHNRCLFLLEALATVSEMIAAITLAYLSSAPPMEIIYPFYIFSSIIFIVTTHKRKIHWMTVLMGFYLCASCVGYIKLFI